MDIIIKTYNLIPSNLRLSFYALIVLMIISVILETFGIALLLPTIAAILDPDSIKEYPIIGDLFFSFDNLFSSSIMFLLVLLSSFYIFKAFFISLVSFFQAKFVYDMKALISQNLFKKYVNLPYENHLQLDSSDLIRNISTETIRFIDGIIKQILFLIVESFIVMGMIIFLFILNPLIISTTFSLFFIVGFLYYAFTRNRLLSWGKRRQDLEARKIETLQQSLIGIKELKVFHKERQFSSIFRSNNYLSAKTEKNQFFVALLPRIILEVTAVIAVILLILILYLQNIQSKDILPLIGIYVAATFKMLPSIQKITHAVQQLRFEKPVLDLIFSEVTTHNQFSMEQNAKIKQNQVSQKKSKGDNLIISGLSFSYFGTKLNAIDDINLDINSGETIGIIGESGSGKTTLINILLGLLAPKSGSIYFDGTNCLENRDFWLQQISFVPQNIFISNESLKKNIAFGEKSSEIDPKRVRQSVEMSQLSDLFSEEKLEGAILGERGSKLSGGQIQRVGIARALYKNPKILIFDEATSSLDSKTENEVMESIYSLPGKRIKIIIAHRISTLDKTDRIFEMKNGRLIRELNFRDLKV